MIYPWYYQLHLTYSALKNEANRWLKGDMTLRTNPFHDNSSFRYLTLQALGSMRVPIYIIETERPQTNIIMFIAENYSKFSTFLCMQQKYRYNSRQYYRWGKDILTSIVASFGIVLCCLMFRNFLPLSMLLSEFRWKLIYICIYSIHILFQIKWGVIPVRTRGGGGLFKIKMLSGKKPIHKDMSL